MKLEISVLMFMSLVLAACSPTFETAYKPDSESFSEIGPRDILQARSALVGSLRNLDFIVYVEQHVSDSKVKDIQIYRDSIHFSFTGSTLGFFKDGAYSGMISINLITPLRFADVILNPSNIYYVDLPREHGQARRTLYWKSDNKDDAVSFAKALDVLIYRATHLKNDAAFQDFRVGAQGWRQLSVKPELPESTRRYLVLAENATEEKRLDDAVDLYLKALKLTPYWPQSHYNLALILAHEELYTEAILQMREYLELVPDAPDARAAKDQIWGWEAKNK